MSVLYANSFDSATLSATGTAAPLATTGTYPNIVEVHIQADPGNGGIVLVGGPTNQLFALSAGDWDSWTVDDIAEIYVKAKTGTQNVNFIVRMNGSGK